MFIQYKGSSCNLAELGPILSLTSLITSPSKRGNGSASFILKAAKKVAKRKNKPIWLFIGPFDDKPMSEEQLARFYNKHGFSFLRDSYGTIFLIYKPS